MTDLISLCIPTCNRPGPLAEAIASCGAQSHARCEIVVGDDSQGDESERVVEALRASCPFPIDYGRNEPRLGQAANVNSLFSRARGARLMLLHDDDWLLPDAARDLAEFWARNPGLDAVWGKQILVGADGADLPDADAFNATYFRDAAHEGTKLSALEAALVQQFPNNAYLLSTETARLVRYRDEGEFGTTRWCDYDFGIRLAQSGAKFGFWNGYTAKYFLGGESVAKSGSPTYMFHLIEKLEVPAEAEWAKCQALGRLAPIVVANHARNGEKAEAWRIFWSEHYGWKRRLSRAGLHRLRLMAAKK